MRVPEEIVRVDDFGGLVERRVVDQDRARARTFRPRGCVAGRVQPWGTDNYQLTTNNWRSDPGVSGPSCQLPVVSCDVRYVAGTMRTLSFAVTSR